MAGVESGESRADGYAVWWLLRMAQSVLGDQPAAHPQQAHQVEARAYYDARCLQVRAHSQTLFTRQTGKLLFTIVTIWLSVRKKTQVWS
jgi:hypothetical protein